MCRLFLVTLLVSCFISVALAKGRRGHGYHHFKKFSKLQFGKHYCHKKHENPVRAELLEGQDPNYLNVRLFLENSDLRFEKIHYKVFNQQNKRHKILAGQFEGNRNQEQIETIDISSLTKGDYHIIFKVDLKVRKRGYKKKTYKYGVDFSKTDEVQNEIPIANIEISEQPNGDLLLDLSGSSDSDGTVISYELTYKNLSDNLVYSVSIDPSSPLVSLSLPNGDYFFSLIVQDDKGGFSEEYSINYTVDIAPPDTLPPIVFVLTESYPDRYVVDLSYSFATEFGAYITTYVINSTNIATGETIQVISQNPIIEVDNVNPGETWQIVAEATDNFGQTGVSPTYYISIPTDTGGSGGSGGSGGGSSSIIATMSCSSDGLAVTCNANGSYSDAGGIVEYIVTSEIGELSFETSEFSLTFIDLGHKELTLKVKDISGNISEPFYFNLTLNNLMVAFNCVQDGLNLNCDASNSSPNGITQYNVEYYDNGNIFYESFTNPNFTLQFTDYGVKEIGLAITDSEGNTSNTFYKSFELLDNTYSEFAINCNHEVDDFIRCNFDHLAGSPASMVEWTVADTPILVNSNVFEFEIPVEESGYKITANITNETGRIFSYSTVVGVGQLYAHQLQGIQLSLIASENVYYGINDNLIIKIDNPDSKLFNISNIYLNDNEISIENYEVIADEIIVSNITSLNGQNQLSIYLDNDEEQSFEAHFKYFAGDASIIVGTNSSEKYDLIPFDEKLPKLIDIQRDMINLPIGDYVLIKKTTEDIRPLLITLGSGEVVTPNYPVINIVDTGEANLDFSDGTQGWTLDGLDFELRTGRDFLSSEDQLILTISPLINTVGSLRKYFVVESENNFLNSKIDPRLNQAEGKYIHLLKNISEGIYQIQFADSKIKNVSLEMNSLKVNQGDFVGIETIMIQTAISTSKADWSFEIINSANAAIGANGFEIDFYKASTSAFAIDSFNLKGRDGGSLNFLSMDNAENMNVVFNLNNVNINEKVGLAYLNEVIAPFKPRDLNTKYLMYADIDINSLVEAVGEQFISDYTIKLYFVRGSAKGPTKLVQYLSSNATSVQDFDQKIPIFPSSLVGDQSLIYDDWKINDRLHVFACILSQYLSEPICRKDRDYKVLRWLGAEYYTSNYTLDFNQKDGGDKWISAVHYGKVSFDYINDISKLNGGHLFPHDEHQDGNDIDVISDSERLLVGSIFEEYLSLESAQKLVSLINNDYILKYLDKLLVGIKDDYGNYGNRLKYEEFRFSLENACLKNGYLLKEKVRAVKGHFNHSHVGLKEEEQWVPRTETLDEDMPFHFVVEHNQDMANSSYFFGHQWRFKIYPRKNGTNVSSNDIEIYTDNELAIQVDSNGDGEDEYYKYKEFKKLEKDSEGFYDMTLGFPKYIVYKGNSNTKCKVLSAKFGSLQVGVQINNFDKLVHDNSIESFIKVDSIAGVYTNPSQSILESSGFKLPEPPGQEPPYSIPLSFESFLTVKDGINFSTSPSGGYSVRFSEDFTYNLDFSGELRSDITVANESVAGSLCRVAQSNIVTLNGVEYYNQGFAMASYIDLNGHIVKGGKDSGLITFVKEENVGNYSGQAFLYSGKTITSKIINAEIIENTCGSN